MEVTNGAIAFAPTARRVIIAVLFKELGGWYRSEQHRNHRADGLGNENASVIKALEKEAGEVRAC